jgi:hypothetical protein
LTVLPFALGMTELPLTALLACPVLGALLLGLLGHYRIGAELNVAVSAATTACAPPSWRTTSCSSSTR